MKYLNGRMLAAGTIPFVLGILIGFVLGPNLRPDIAPSPGPTPTRTRPPMVFEHSTYFDLGAI